MFEFQTQLIFPTHAVPAAGPLPPGSQRLQVVSADGHLLHGVHVSPEGHSGPKTLILGFGGNAWNGEDVASYLHEVFPDADVVAFHYRGYAPSAGSPSADALIADAPLVYDAAVKAVGPERVIAVGFSIGSGVAAQLSRQRRLDGLILVTPFDSLKAVAQSMYPWLPIGPFFEHELDAGGALAKAKVPVAIVAAERDEIVPAERTDALRALVPRLVFDRTIARAGHNDIYARSDFQLVMREALASLTGAK
ncbi:MAG TPA: alpha/beta hydrolase [Sphingomicrobium sp.]